MTRGATESSAVHDRAIRAIRSDGGKSGCKFVCLVAAALIVCAAIDDRTALIPGVIVERQIRGGERQLFAVSLNAGETLKIAVDQLGADVVVEADFDRGATADDETKHHYGRELLVWAAPAAGTATIAVRAKSTIEPIGHYRLSATVFPADSGAAAAAEAFNDALASARVPESDTAANERAAARFAAARDLWRAVDDRELVAACLVQLARITANSLFRDVDAIPMASASAAIYDDLGQPTELVASLSVLAFAQVGAGQAEASAATLERSYRHAADVDPVVRAQIEDDIARSAMDTDLDRAVAFGERAANTFRTAGASHEESYSLERLALTYSRMGRYDEALRSINRAIELGRQYGRENDVATMMLSIGRIQMVAGDDEAALAAYRDSLGMFKGQTSNAIVARLAMGRIFDRRDDAAQAQPILEDALARVPPQLKDLWAAVATELGVCLALRGDPARALDLQRKALEIEETAGARVPQLTILHDMARTYRALGDGAAADRVVDRAADLAAQLPGNPYGPLILRERARNARAAGDLAGARAALDEAIQIAESTRGRLQSQALRTSFGGTLQDYYDDAIALALQMHAAAPEARQDVRAFELFERSRARSLADLLSERGIDVTAGLDAALVAEQRGLQRQLAARDSALRDLGADPSRRGRATAIEREIAEIERRLAVVDGRIRASSPRFAALAHPEPATLAETQQLLDDRTVLVAFDVAASCGWAVTRSSILLFALSSTSRIDLLAHRLLEAIQTSRQQDLRTDGEARGRELDRGARELSDALLGPIGDRLTTVWRTSRLAIVASGSLEFVPFSVLPVPRRLAGGTLERLVDRHDIVQLPSVSILAALRRQPPVTAKGVAVIADPVYASDDPRVHVAGPSTLPSVSSLHEGHAVPVRRAGARRGAESARPDAIDRVLRSAADDSSRGGLERLVFSRDEANAIASLASRRRVFEALDFAANLPVMSTPAVSGARIVHIASHGLFNSTHPELSGIVLSLVDDRGRPRNGVLHLYDVLNLKLAADLVVLSGCQTALGPQMRGEGLTGISRAFMYAGARHVVASLWAVDDRATAELMRRFYRALLVDGRRPAAALALAQRDLSADSRWHSPFYWAGFTLIGDWR
ncbi:MAG TPA: CHAT domain-containing tetratricopeptide repeat protein [Vicinamibacterales bacterium]|nr:CHAT domain-containing tetratricopeptide repeat protein [Vicinamibacterales bacterium]